MAGSESEVTNNVSHTCNRSDRVEAYRCTLHALWEALVVPLGEKFNVLRALHQQVIHCFLDHLLRHVQHRIEICKGDLGLEHPKFCQVRLGVRIFCTEGRGAQSENGSVNRGKTYYDFACNHAN